MRVSFVQDHVKHYRVPFFNDLFDLLGSKGVKVRLLHAEPAVEQRLRRDSVPFDRGTPIRAHRISIGSRQLVWHGALRLTRDDDLVILSEASWRLLAYPLLAKRSIMQSPKVACWGHGPIDRGVDRSTSSGVILRRRLAPLYDWWFAYTEESSLTLKRFGVDPSRISTVNNTIDVELLAECVEEERRSMPVSASTRPTAIYIGSLYRERQLSLLVSVGQYLAERVSGFELVIAGAGPSEAEIAQAAARFDWLRLTGPVFGSEKVELLARARAILVPASVGLTVLDSFASGVPLVCVGGGSNPEESYLRHDVNGFVAKDAREFEALSVQILTHNEVWDRLSQGARDSAREYTLESMVQRYADGVMGALATPSTPRWLHHSQ